MKNKQVINKYSQLTLQNRTMLPRVNQIQGNQKIDQQLEKTELKLSNISKITKKVEQAAFYQQKYDKELNLNTKLKTLLSTIKSNQQTATKVYEQQQQLLKLQKQRKKWQLDLQHQANSLNSLIAENNKLKDQVNTQRSKRVIYFNVYKNLEREIHHWETKYKNLIVESLKMDATTQKIKDKFRKNFKKMEKDIQTLNQQIQHIQHQDTKQEQQIWKAINSKTNQLKVNALQPQQEINPSINNLNSSTVTENTNIYRTALLADNQNTKLNDMQLQYEMEQKRICVQGIMNRLKQLTGKIQITDCIKQLKNINEQIEYNFNLFKQQQLREKQLIKQLNQLQKSLSKIQDQNQLKKTTVIELHDKKQMDQLNQRIIEMERQLQQRIGIKVNEVSNEMLLHHCLRIRDNNQKKKRNLQKNLQLTKKQKSQCSIILSPKEMHKRIVQSQTRMI